VVTIEFKKQWAYPGLTDRLLRSPRRSSCVETSLPRTPPGSS